MDDKDRTANDYGEPRNEFNEGDFDDMITMGLDPWKEEDVNIFRSQGRLIDTYDGAERDMQRERESAEARDAEIERMAEAY